MEQDGDAALRTSGWGLFALPAERRRMRLLRDKYELLAAKLDVEARTREQGVGETAEGVEEAAPVDGGRRILPSAMPDVATGVDDAVGRTPPSAPGSDNHPQAERGDFSGLHGPVRADRGIPDELVAGAVAGDRGAVDQLMRAIRPLVARYVRARLGPADRPFIGVDDVTQEVCIAILAALPTYRVQGRSFMAFVYGIASHKVTDAHRAMTRGRTAPTKAVAGSLEDDASSELAMSRKSLTQLRALLDELPERQREVLVLRTLVGLTTEETAEIMGSTPGAIKLAQRRALARLGREKSHTLEKLAEDLNPPATAFGP